MKIQKAHKRFKNIIKLLEQGYLYYSLDDVYNLLADNSICSAFQDSILYITINNATYPVNFYKFIDCYFCNREDLDEVVRFGSFDNDIIDVRVFE